MLENWKRRRAVDRVRGGDGRALTPFRWWHLLTGRKLFYLPRAGRDGAEADYAVDVYASGKNADAGGYGKAHLFRDGRHFEQARLPAVFPIEGGEIEVAETLSGLRRAHFVTTGGDEILLTPDPRSAIGRRLGFDRDHPTASRAIGAVSVVLLVVGLGLNALQLLEPILGIPPIVEQFGRFESPIHLPLWLNVALGAAAGLASTERALRLRYNWLLDAAGN
jgi:hypothetical protein